MAALLLASVFSFAQYSDAVLFDAYLRSDMSVWNAYLHAYDFNKLSLAEKERYLNYEYGYVATAIDLKEPDAEQHLQNFEKHIEALKPHLEEAMYLDYRSSCVAYKALMNKAKFISYGLESKKLIYQAFEVDSLNPSVLTLKGNVDFYAPKMIGGNKQRALGYFYKAQRLFEQKGDTVNNWNYVSCLQCQIECEVKVGNTDKAIRLARKLLTRYPQHAYIRDTLLPDLLKKQKKK